MLKNKFFFIFAMIFTVAPNFGMEISKDLVSQIIQDNCITYIQSCTSVTHNLNNNCYSGVRLIMSANARYLNLEDIDDVSCFYEFHRLKNLYKIQQEKSAEQK